jgi:hypothetical protein
MNEEWINLSEAARLLNVSRAKVSKLVAAGLLVPQSDPLDDRSKLSDVKTCWH